MCNDATIGISYHESPAETFRSFSRHQILRTNGIDCVLDQAARFGKQLELDLPSWVPDWRTVERIRYAFSDITSFNMSDSFASDRPQSLILHGFQLAMLKQDEPSEQGTVYIHIDWTGIKDIKTWDPRVNSLSSVEMICPSNYFTTTPRITAACGDVLIDFVEPGIPS